MESDSDPPDLYLAQQRYLVLIRQLYEAAVKRIGRTHDAGTAVAKRLGISQPMESQVRLGVKRPGPRSIESAIKAGWAREYFYNEKLVDPNPDDYYRRSPESTVERESDEGHAAIERYIEAMASAGTPVEPGHQVALRGLRYAMGPDSITEEVVRGTHRGLVARDANRAIDAPIVPAEIDVGRGQRALPPKKRKT